METENKELTEEITKLESDKKMFQSASAQVIEEKHQLETSVMQVQTENNQLKTENNQLRNQVAAERIQLESQHQREKQLLQSEVERLTKELERITTVSISKKSLVSTMHSYQQCFFKNILPKLLVPNLINLMIKCI